MAVTAPRVQAAHESDFRVEVPANQQVLELHPVAVGGVIESLKWRAASKGEPALGIGHALG